MTTTVTFYVSESKSKWGADFNPDDVNTEAFGTGTFTFPACDVGSVTITPNQKYADLGYTEISYDLSRDITDYKVACPSLVLD